MKLRGGKDISYNKSSLFHGAIMELLPYEYANQLHLSQLRPYSIHLEKENDIWSLVVATMDEEAYSIIIAQTLSKLDKIYIKHDDKIIYIDEKIINTLPKKSITQAFYNGETTKVLDIGFITPTAFKSKGDYVFFPDLRLIYQSLMNKYDACSDNGFLFDSDILEELCKGSRISSYKLRSNYFQLEGIKIPAFTGSIRVKITANQTITNFINMLFEYGKYSGVGIKSSLGMGAIRLIKGGINIE
jgi:CRISPR-associated endoribonuclease cas6